MGRSIKILLSSLILLISLLLYPGCDKKTYEDSGILEGKISIGPLCPVESVPPDPRCLPTLETYKAYPIAVWTSDRKRRICQLNPSIEGFYSAGLNPGKYLIILERTGNNIGGSNLPVEVTINPARITTLNIDIDTGIR